MRAVELWFCLKRPDSPEPYPSGYSNRKVKPTKSEVPHAALLDQGPFVSVINQTQTGSHILFDVSFLHANYTAILKCSPKAETNFPEREVPSSLDPSHDADRGQQSKTL